MFQGFRAYKQFKAGFFIAHTSLGLKNQTGAYKVLLVNPDETLGVWYACNVCNILPCNLNTIRVHEQLSCQIKSLIWDRNFFLLFRSCHLKLQDIMKCLAFKHKNHPREITVYMSLESIDGMKCKVTLQGIYFQFISLKYTLYQAQQVINTAL